MGMIIGKEPTPNPSEEGSKTTNDAISPTKNPPKTYGKK